MHCAYLCFKYNIIIKIYRLLKIFNFNRFLISLYNYSIYGNFLITKSQNKTIYCIVSLTLFFLDLSPHSIQKIMIKVLLIIFRNLVINFLINFITICHWHIDNLVIWWNLWLFYFI